MMRKTLGLSTFAFASMLAACSWGGSSQPSTSSTPPDASNGSSVTPTPVCGDGICSASEANSCPADCGPGGHGPGSGSGSSTATCGDFVCQASESAATCPSDCSGSGSGSGSGGTLNCSDPNTLLGCFACASGTCTPPYDTASCATCGF